MDSRITLALAGVLLMGAVGAGYWGLSLSQQPAAAVDSTASDAPRSPSVADKARDATRSAVVVALRDLPADMPLKAEDLAIELVRTAPPGSFNSIEQVLERSPWAPVAAGSWLHPEVFEAGGALAKRIRPEERALAITVDEVIGGGGHLRPGDHVDVMLYLREDGQQRNETAQLVLPAARLLSYGSALQPQPNALSREPAQDTAESSRSTPRSAVLAVPHQAVSRLLLASQAGTLRLAVRSADEKLQQRYLEGETGPITLDAHSRNLLNLSALKGSSPAARPVSSAPSRPAAPRATVEVIRGVESTRQNP